MISLVDPELIVGIVGRLGIDTNGIFNAIKEALHTLRYETHRIKITDFVRAKESLAWGM